MDGDYSKREIDQMFGGVHDRLTNQDTKLDKILAQAIKTNGRVNKLENWRWLLTGAIVIISTMVIPLLIFIYNNSPISK